MVALELAVALVQQLNPGVAEGGGTGWNLWLTRVRVTC